MKMVLNSPHVALSSSSMVSVLFRFQLSPVKRPEHGHERLCSGLRSDSSTDLGAGGSGSPCLSLNRFWLSEAWFIRATNRASTSAGRILAQEGSDCHPSYACPGCRTALLLRGKWGQVATRSYPVGNLTPVLFCRVGIFTSFRSELTEAAGLQRCRLAASVTVGSFQLSSLVTDFREREGAVGGCKKPLEKFKAAKMVTF